MTRKTYEWETIPRLTINKNKLKMKRYIDSNRGYSRDEITKIVQDFSNNSKNKNGYITAALYYPNYGWRPGYFTKMGDKVQFYSHDDYEENTEADPEYYPRFTIFESQGNIRKGGEDELNDCLWVVIDYVLGPRNPWSNPAKLKKYLSLSRTEPIDIALMPIIEKKLKNHKINVTGDHCYTSPKEASFEINIQLNNGHYTVNTDKMFKVFGVQFYPRKPVIYRKSANNEFELYDGKTKSLADTKKVNSLLNFKEPNQRTILIKLEETEYKDKDSKTKWTLEEYYDKWVKDSKALFEASDEKINTRKTGTDKRTALTLWEETVRDVVAEPLEQDEAEWISKASSGGIIFGEKYEGPCWNGDVKSMYPSIMAHKNMLFPIKRGEFKVIDEIKKDNGIYRCIIKGINKKLMRPNLHNLYTTMDVIRATELGYEIELIKDGNVNFLYYDRNKCLTGAQLFGQFVNTMFPLKEQKIGRAKMILNILHGALSERRSNIRYTSDDKDLTLSDVQLVGICQTDDDRFIKVDYSQNKARYLTNFARIGPFLYARARYLISKHISELGVDNVLRCHTDSIYSKVPIPNSMLGTDMGDLRYEGYCPNVVIHNAKKPTGEFKK